jgi:hypothetical protein
MRWQDELTLTFLAESHELNAMFLAEWSGR